MMYRRVFLAAYMGLAAFLVLVPLPAGALEAPSAYLADHAPRYIAKVEGRYGHIIDRASALHRLEPSLVLAVIVVESEGNEKAVSKRGAHGLMQLMPRTARALGVTDIKDPEQNILAGARYLRELEDDYGYATEAELLVAYNMGPAGAKRWLVRGDAEDHSYAEKVLYVKSLIDERERAFYVAFGSQAKQVVAAAESPALGDISLSGLKPLLTKPQTLALGAQIPATLAAQRLKIIEVTD